ncbi:hypothetical protein Nepgr_013613 [Nepenthes gracilis]|uniref:Uncharacterized protein n=1 Tax=Nepenthes gracilis TaxID=150966 RepID=A0AAD3XNU0_NEPGR|nr:hypothetical protein Nepgr_013613 [Nepenthes gracilis]
MTRNATTLVVGRYCSHGFQLKSYSTGDTPEVPIKDKIIQESSMTTSNKTCCPYEHCGNQEDNGIAIGDGEGRGKKVEKTLDKD